MDVAMAADANGFQAALVNCGAVGMAGPALIDAGSVPVDARFIISAGESRRRTDLCWD